jgi:tetratricopeptide (TPR) repeat protein
VAPADTGIRLTDPHVDTSAHSRPPPGPQLQWRELLDALWLASRITDADRSDSGTASAPDSADDPSRQPFPGESNDRAPGDDVDAAPGPLNSPDQRTTGGVSQPRATSRPRGTPSADPPEAPEDTLSLPGRLRLREARAHEPGRALPSRPAPADLTSVARALRPLKKTAASRRDSVLDETATAEQLIDEPAWLPVFRPGVERFWQVVLVVDQGPTMRVWRDTVRRLRQVLERQGFRDVLVRLLSTQGASAQSVTLRSPAQPEVPRPASGLIVPGERRIVLVLTDGAAPAWRSGAALQVIASWGMQHPTTVLHLLPESRWHLTGIRAEPVRLRASRPGEPNGQLDCEPYGVSPPDPPDPAGAADPTGAAGAAGADRPGPHRVAVPVLELDHRWLAPWAKLVAGETREWINLAAVFAAPPGKPVGPQDDDTGELPPPTAGPDRPEVARKQVADFRAAVSPAAFELATYLAAAPLDVDLMQTIQARLMPTSTTRNLSEILISPLLQPKQPRTASGSLRVSFAFAPGVREELLASGRRTDIVRVARTLDDRLGPRQAPLLGLTTVLDTPDDVPTRSVSAESKPWLEVEAAVLGALSGRYAHRARRTEQALSRWERDHVTARGGRDRVVPADQHSNSRTLGTDMVSGHPGQPAEVPTPSATEFGSEPTVARTAPDSTVPTSDPRPPAEGQRVPQTLDQPQQTDHAVQVRARRRPKIVGNFPLRNPNFTGREDLLAQLHDRLRSEGTTAVLPHALHGMGGVGKSLLAIEYIYRHQAEYDIIWWIPAEQTTRIAGALVELAQRLGLQGVNEANTAVPMVLEALRSNDDTNYQNWLLVFDNAESPELVRPYLPKGGSGDILITSRDARWAQVAEPLEVNVFERAESRQLLQNRSPELSDTDADRLAQRLGDLPLAIEQAAAWRAETGMPVDEYLRLLEEKEADLLELSPPLDYQIPVIAAWNVSLDRLEARSPAALQLLQVCSFFAAEPIPRSLLVGARTTSIAPELDGALRDPIRLGRAIREVTRYSLAKIDHRTNSIQMHRLVQAALIARMNEEQRAQMRHGAHLMLAANDPNDPESPDQFERYGELYPHLIASSALECGERWVRALVINEARYLYRWGDHHAARQLSQRAHQSWSIELGEADPQTLEIAKHLGFVLWVVGRYAEAAELNKSVLATYERMRTEGNEDREGELEALRNVAIDRRAQGEFASALSISQDVLESTVRIFGPDDPTTLNAAHNLAVSLRLSGDFAQAREVDTDTFNRKLEIFGPDHPLTLITQLGLVIDVRELGDYVMALDVQDVLAQAILSLGELHPQALFAQRLLAVAQRKAGLHQEALNTSRLVSARLETRYSKAHPQALAAASNLSIDLRQTGDLSAARELGGEIHQRYVQTLGEDHPHTLSAEVNLAITHRLLGELDRARELDESALTSFRRRLGQDHPSTLVCAVNFASDMFEMGDFEAAYRLDLDTRDRLTRIFHQDHPTTLACAANLALDLRALGRLDEAETLHDEVAERLRATLGDQHAASQEAMDWTRRANCDLDAMPL